MVAEVVSGGRNARFEDEKGRGWGFGSGDPQNRRFCPDFFSLIKKLPFDLLLKNRSQMIRNLVVSSSDAPTQSPNRSGRFLTAWILNFFNSFTSFDSQTETFTSALQCIIAAAFVCFSASGIKCFFCRPDARTEVTNRSWCSRAEKQQETSGAKRLILTGPSSRKEVAASLFLNEAESFDCSVQTFDLICFDLIAPTGAFVKITVRLPASANQSPALRWSSRFHLRQSRRDEHVWLNNRHHVWVSS